MWFEMSYNIAHILQFLILHSMDLEYQVHTKQHSMLMYKQINWLAKVSEV